MRQRSTPRLKAAAKSWTSRFAATNAGSATITVTAKPPLNSAKGPSISSPQPKRPTRLVPTPLQPVVIAEMETKIASITVGEAVMQMELGGQKMLVFRNEGHGGVNVVYRREDGNIGWIDPRNSK